MQLWENPELNYEETFAAGLLADYLEQSGAVVERDFCGIPTGFKATADTGVEGPTVAICCEFDALPGIGHACGHNLIAEATVAGFVGAQAGLAAGAGAGKLVLIGTPAEEGGAGKVEMIKRDGFADVDMAMMVHPGPGATLYTAGNAMEMVDIIYRGRNSHAAGAPWDGVNALNAVIQAFNNVDAMRQQFKPSWRVHGVITEGGVKPNIIPDDCRAQWYIRALTVDDVAELRSKVEGCFQGAALSTGCELEMEWKADSAAEDYTTGCHMYANMVSNGAMCEAFRDNWDALGQPAWPTMEEDIQKTASGGGSTDMGNLSHYLPSIHPSFKIDTKFGNHHPGFTEYTCKPHNLETARAAGKSVALTCLDLLATPALVSAAKAEFEAGRAAEPERRSWTPEFATR
jgi:amidohydrolase